MSSRTTLAAVALGASIIVCASPSYAQEKTSQTNGDWGSDAAPNTSTTTTTTTTTAQPYGVSTTRTTMAEYKENAGAEQEEAYRPNRPLVITGAALFLAPYVTGVIVAAQSNLDADKRNYIPVAGPWLDLGQRPCSFGSGCSTTDNVGSALLIASGVSQGVGIVLAAVGLAVPEKTERRTARAAAVAPKPTVHVAPVSFFAGGGLGASGTF